MKKTVHRKKLAHVFSKFIRLGLYRNSLGPMDVCRRIWGSCGTESAARDAFALWELWRIFKAEGREEELRLFALVYAPKGRVRGVDAEARILEYARKNYCDPRTVYRRLAAIEKRYQQLRDSIE